MTETDQWSDQWSDQGQHPTEPLPRSDDGESHSYLEELQQIGQYKIESFLQCGGMNFLYLGTDLKTDQPVAIKILLPKFASRKDIMERFLREAEILSIADHPNIVKMYCHGPWEHGYYIAMEFITGGSLRQYLLENPLSLKRALEMILEISYAICHLHTHGIIHRDLKLENILVTEDGNIKVIDFGIAQLLADVKEEERSVFLHRTIGTPIYMSPEQRENPENVSYPSDIYSLGIIAYELVLGRFSHGHVHLSLMPKGLQKILSKALQHNPNERYQDIVDFIGDLSEYLNSEALQKDRRVGDQTSELFDNLQKTKKILFNRDIPKWPLLNIGLATTEGSVNSSRYGDFLQFSEDSFVILFGESIALDSEAIISSSAIRGMARALLKTKSSLKEFVSELNKLLLEDPGSAPYALCSLSISPNQKSLSFISCGYGYLWRIPKGGEILEPLSNSNFHLKVSGAEFNESVFSLKEGDQLLLYCGIYSPDIEAILMHGAIEYSGLPPQQKAEGMMRRLRLVTTKFSQNDLKAKTSRPGFSVLCIQLENDF
ncbi:MAG: protein kinase [Parachlamydiaceae bacterium]|nr:protein kinase [Parachlamydiaceae bacterium]